MWTGRVEAGSALLFPTELSQKARVGCSGGTAHRPAAVLSGTFIVRNSIPPNCRVGPPSGLMAAGHRRATMMKVLKGGRLIDGTGAGPQAGATVIIRDQRIEAVTTKAVGE